MEKLNQASSIITHHYPFVMIGILQGSVDGNAFEVDLVNSKESFVG